MRNISAPKDHEESQGAPRMLRLQMTDGHTTCVGLEFKHLSKIRYLYNSSVASRNMLSVNNLMLCIVIVCIITACSESHYLCCFKNNNSNI